MRICLLFFACFCSLFASPLSFQAASENEIIYLESLTLSIYAKQLVLSGLFKSEGAALEAAKQEEQPEDVVYLHLISSDFHDTNVGFLGYTREHNSAHIEYLYVNENFRGLGYGKEALYSLSKRLQEEGVNQITLFVFAHNLIAHNLYKKMGFVTDDTSYFEGKLIGYFMSKRI